MNQPEQERKQPQPPTPQEEIEFWLQVRRGLAQVVRAIEKRYSLDSYN